MFEGAIVSGGHLLSPCKAPGDKEENSPAECSGAAGCSGQGYPGHPQRYLNEVTEEWWLLCSEILNGSYTRTNCHKRAQHDQRSPSHQWLTSANLALNKIEVVYLDYVFTVAYNALGFPK